MEVEARLKAVEERLSEVEIAQRAEGTAMQQLFEFVKRIDANMTTLVVRTQALETNFSLLNASVSGMDKKIDQMLELMRHPPGAASH